MVHHILGKNLPNSAENWAENDLIKRITKKLPRDPTSLDMDQSPVLFRVIRKNEKILGSILEQLKLPANFKFINLRGIDLLGMSSEALEQNFKKLPSDLIGLSLAGAKVKQDTAAELISLIQSLPRNLEFLDLGISNLFSKLTTEQLIEVFQHLPPKLTYLNLSGSIFNSNSINENNGRTPEQLAAIIAALPRGLVSLGLGNNKIFNYDGEGLKKIFGALPPSLRNLKLNNIRTSSPFPLASFMQALPPQIIALDLSRNMHGMIKNESDTNIFRNVPQQIRHLVLGYEDLAELEPQQVLTLGRKFSHLMSLRLAHRTNSNHRGFQNTINTYVGSTLLESYSDLLKIKIPKVLPEALPKVLAFKTLEQLTGVSLQKLERFITERRKKKTPYLYAHQYYPSEESMEEHRLFLKLLFRATVYTILLSVGIALVAGLIIGTFYNPISIILELICCAGIAATLRACFQLMGRSMWRNYILREIKDTPLIYDPFDPVEVLETAYQERNKPKKEAVEGGNIYGKLPFFKSSKGPGLCLSLDDNPEDAHPQPAPN